MSIRAGETAISLVQVAVQLARGSDHRIGVLAFTMSEEKPDQDCLFEETLGKPELVRIVEAEGVTGVTAQLVARDVAMCIAQLAGQLETRLILMGWSGAPLHRLFASNTAKQVLNTAPNVLENILDEAGKGYALVLVGPSEQPLWRDWFRGRRLSG